MSSDSRRSLPGDNAARPLDAGRQRAGLASHNLEIFRSLVESVRDYAIFVLDPGGRVSTWNIGAERVKGYRAAGSTFTVRLPLSNATESAHPSPASPEVFPAADGKRVLVVDDNEDACDLIADVLRMKGHRVTTATDAVQALVIARDFEPELAILDIGLPVMDGYELAAQLRAERATPFHLVALTGYGQPNDQERSRQAGFHAHLIKPIDIQRLLDTIEALPPLPT